MTLTEFLLARVAEDEAAAHRVDGMEFAELLPAAQVFGMRGLMMPAARVLAECEAKRRIVALHAISATSQWVNPPDGPAYQETELTCAVCGWVPDACDTVKALALPYATHPDYDPAWAL